MATLITRSAWGAAPSKRALSTWSGGQPSSITIHYESTDYPTDLPESSYSAIVRSVQNYHMWHAADDYSDIAYNFLVSPIGGWYEGRGWSYRSGAQGSVGNPVSLAVCYIGGPNTPLTAAAITTILQIVAESRGRGNSGPIWPHNHWLATQCPGRNILSWIGAGCPSASGDVIPNVTPDWAAIVKAAKANTIKALESQDSRGVVLRRGATGADVKAWQDALNLTSKYGLVADGDFGANTAYATLVFQSFWKLTADAAVGPKTRSVARWLLSL